MVFLDDMVVVLHDSCCCCVALHKGALLAPRKMMGVCVWRAAVCNGGDCGVVLCVYVTYNCLCACCYCC